MNVLSGRSAYDSGVIAINGKPVGDSTMKRLMSKVATTSRRALWTLGGLRPFTYTVLLRMPRNIPTPHKDAGVGCVVQYLRLLHSHSLEKFGGGKKRVNTGTELLTDPVVLFLWIDDYTSGIDSTVGMRFF
jgi:ABC-type multidrug transport system ATPase subunit